MDLFAKPVFDEYPGFDGHDLRDECWRYDGIL